jgi:hypothetical protein
VGTGDCRASSRRVYLEAGVSLAVIATYAEEGYNANLDRGRALLKHADEELTVQSNTELAERMKKEAKSKLIGEKREVSN